MTAELLSKVRNAPGLCSREEIQQVMDFYQDLWEKSSLFRKAIGYDPIGLTLPSLMDSLKYYLGSDSSTDSDSTSPALLK